MKKGLNIFFFAMSFLLRFIIVSLVISPFISLIYTIISAIIYQYLIYKNKNINIIAPIVMSDFLVYFGLSYKGFDSVLTIMIFSFVSFIVANIGVYFYLIARYCENNSLKNVKRKANNHIDRGIKALEDDNYDLAIESFTNAIKEHKKNYLGYMGMCNTLSKMDEKNLKKFNYYKKRCIKYAPRELKKSIKNKY